MNRFNAIHQGFRWAQLSCNFPVHTWPHVDFWRTRNHLLPFAGLGLITDNHLEFRSEGLLLRKSFNILQTTTPLKVSRLLNWLFTRGEKTHDFTMTRNRFLETNMLYWSFNTLPPCSDLHFLNHGKKTRDWKGHQSMVRYFTSRSFHFPIAGFYPNISQV